MSRMKHVMAATAALSIACVAHAQSVPTRPPASPPVVVSVATVATTPMAEMQRLIASTQELRDAIQLLALKPPGPERDVAIGEARKALQRTQMAMLALPPEYRQPAAAAAAGEPRGYDPSVRALMDAADALRQSIQAMAREPAGPGRNEAVREANRALLATQAAMANAYDVTAFPKGTVTVGGTPLQCTWLGTMWGCT